MGQFRANIFDTNYFNSQLLYFSVFLFFFKDLDLFVKFSRPYNYFFFSNFPVPTFISCPTSIPESRVL